MNVNLKGSFLAGLFDAEGNVNKWDNNLRISQLTKENVDLIKFLLDTEGYHFNYDGCNFVIGNREMSRKDDFIKFKNEILPHMNHPTKIRDLNDIFDGNLTKESFKVIVQMISERPGLNQNQLREILHKRCYRELKALVKENYLISTEYPHKFFVTDKGIRWVNGGEVA